MFFLNNITFSNFDYTNLFREWDSKKIILLIIIIINIRLIQIKFVVFMCSISKYSFNNLELWTYYFFLLVYVSLYLNVDFCQCLMGFQWLFIKRLWKPRFTPSIFVIGEKSRNSNFSWSPELCAIANDNWPNKCRKYEKTTKQIYREIRSLFRIRVRAMQSLWMLGKTTQV